MRHPTVAVPSWYCSYPTTEQVCCLPVVEACFDADSIFLHVIDIPLKAHDRYVLVAQEGFPGNIEMICVG